MASTSTFPKSSLAKLGFHPKLKPFKVMVLGQAAIGKTALVVRFITRRFIGEYDPNLEQIYTFQTVIDNETVNFEILDSAGELREDECSKLEANIRWAEAFILMYSVTDKCSFDECHRLKFLINYNNKRRRRLASSVFREDRTPEIPVVLVGNKTDIAGDRMVSTAEGQRLSQEIGCVVFHEISVRESIEQCWEVFRDVRQFWRMGGNCVGRRGEHSAPLLPPLSTLLASAASDDSAAIPNATAPIACHWLEELEEEEEQMRVQQGCSTGGARAGATAAVMKGFRARASTAPRLSPRLTSALSPLSRRLSVVAMRGNNNNSY